MSTRPVFIPELREGETYLPPHVELHDEYGFTGEIPDRADVTEAHARHILSMPMQTYGNPSVNRLYEATTTYYLETEQLALSELRDGEIRGDLIQVYMNPDTFAVRSLVRNIEGTRL